MVEPKPPLTGNRPALAKKRRFARDLVTRGSHGIGNHPWGVGVVGTLLALAIATLPLHLIATERQEALERARENAGNLNTIIAGDLERNAQFHDLYLQTIAAGAQDVRVWHLPEDLRTKLMFGRGASGAYMDGEYVIGTGGEVLAAGDGSQVGDVRLDDRDYFRVHRDDPRVGLYVSHPLRSRFQNGKPAIGVSRRINGPNGRFAGVALLVVRLEFFQQLFDRINTDETGSVMIALDDGTVLARKPFSEWDVGASIAHLPGFAQMAGNTRGWYTAQGPDHVERIYTFIHVPGIPVMTIVAPSVERALAGWRRQSLVTEAVALAFAVMLALGTWALAFALRDRLVAQRELADMAATDPLTGLSNRRMLEYRLQDAWEHGRRDRLPMSILFADIDHFKRFNDNHGHAEGDKVLAEVARCLAAAARRAVDIVARYGGEEFAVVLPDTPPDDAVQIADTMRRNVEALGRPNAGSAHGKVTVSIGCATCVPSERVRPDELLALADAQLYAAKSAGRNRVRAIVAAEAASGSGLAPLDPVDPADTGGTAAASTAQAEGREPPAGADADSAEAGRPNSASKARLNT